MTFFASLVKDELQTIARYMSRQPRGKQWRREISKADLQILLGCSSQFSSVLGDLFPKLHIEHSIKNLTPQTRSG